MVNGWYVVVFSCFAPRFGKEVLNAKCLNRQFRLSRARLLGVSLNAGAFYESVSAFTESHAMKTAREEGQQGEPQVKKARLGVGSSVAPLTRHATDDFMLVLAKTRVERLLPKGRKIYVAERTETLPQAFQVCMSHSHLHLHEAAQRISSPPRLCHFLLRSMILLSNQSPHFMIWFSFQVSASGTLPTPALDFCSGSVVMSGLRGPSAANLPLHASILRLRNSSITMSLLCL